MEIYHSDGDKIDQLNKRLCEKAGFPGVYPVSTQTVRLSSSVVSVYDRRLIEF